MSPHETSSNGDKHMAMTPEAKVKKKVVAVLKDLGAYYFYPVTGGYGHSGVPDIECKAGKNKTTALQQLALDNISKQGGLALVINEANIGEVVESLNQIPFGR